MKVCLYDRGHHLIHTKLLWTPNIIHMRSVNTYISSRLHVILWSRWIGDETIFPFTYNLNKGIEHHIIAESPKFQAMQLYIIFSSLMTIVEYNRTNPCTHLLFMNISFTPSFLVLINERKEKEGNMKIKEKEGKNETVCWCP